MWNIGAFSAGLSGLLIAFPLARRYRGEQGENGLFDVRVLAMQARVEVDRAKTILSASEIVAREAEIRAPEDGIVLHRLAEPGQLLGPGQPALTLAFAGRLYVRTFVPEPRLGQVRQGQAVMVRVDAFPARTFPARITEISPDAEFTPNPVETREERVNLVYAAKADLDAGWDAPLVPGQPAEVIVELASAAAAAPAGR